MNYQQLKNNFERELLFQIISNLRLKRLTNDESKRIARDFLPIINCENEKEFIKNLSKLSERYPQVRDAYLRTIEEYDNSQKNEKLLYIRSILKNDKKGGDNNGN